MTKMYFIVKETESNEVYYEYEVIYKLYECKSREKLYSELRRDCDYFNRKNMNGSNYDPFRCCFIIAQFDEYKNAKEMLKALKSLDVRENVIHISCPECGGHTTVHKGEPIKCRWCGTEYKDGRFIASPLTRCYESEYHEIQFGKPIDHFVCHCGVTINGKRYCRKRGKLVDYGGTCADSKPPKMYEQIKLSEW